MAWQQSHRLRLCVRLGSRENKETQGSVASADRGAGTGDLPVGQHSPTGPRTLPDADATCSTPGFTELNPKSQAYSSPRC